MPSMYNFYKYFNIIMKIYLCSQKYIYYINLFKFLIDWYLNYFNYNKKTKILKYWQKLMPTKIVKY